jgi:hypothetical protein
MTELYSNCQKFQYIFQLGKKTDMSQTSYSLLKFVILQNYDILINILLNIGQYGKTFVRAHKP